VGGQAAEQIIAGVVLSERLAITMYGAIHRAQWAGQRNLRGLVIDPRMLAEPAFRGALVDTAAIATVTALEHPNIVPTVAVESGGPDVVVVTRGVGRYVTVQDLIAAARADRKEGGKLALPVAAAIGKSVVEALAAAHAANIVHGAVHPRSVLIDEDGAVRLGDFVVGKALTTAVAQGADSALWRGLAGYLAPELVVGEDPTPAGDVYAAGALLFTMLSGEVPPGSLHCTPAVERLVFRALDTDLARRYRHAGDLLENLLEAFEDDRWEIAGRGAVIKAAGLSRTDGNIDDATEDLLASLGSAPGAVQVTPIRPSVDIRAEAVAARHTKTPTAANRLDALLADLDDAKELTQVDDQPFKRDPISEIIQLDPRKREAIVQVKPRVPSLDDPDDETPLPPPEPGTDPDLLGSHNGKRVGRSSPRADEVAAMDVLAGLDAPVRLSSAADAAELAAAKLEHAAKRAEAAASRVELPRGPDQPVRRAQPIVDPIADLEVPPPRIKSRTAGILGAMVLLGLIGGAIYLIRENQQKYGEEKEDAEARRKAEEEQRERDRLDKQRLLGEAQHDPGAIVVAASPVPGAAWLKLGRTPLTTEFHLHSSPGGAASIEIRVELAGHQPIDTQITGAHWSGDKGKRSAKISVPLRPLGKQPAVALPPQPDEPPRPQPGEPSTGPITVQSTPPGAEVWLFLGGTPARIEGVVAGRPYELRVLQKNYLPGFAGITADEWREPDDDPRKPIDSAKKHAVIEKAVELAPDPDAGKRGRPGKR
jgi:serine/threonine protein kinase